MKLRDFQIETKEKSQHGNVIVTAPTGKGKTLALLLAIEDRISEGKCVIISPLIWLCQQLVNVSEIYFENWDPPIKIGSCFGGVSPQKRKVIWKECDLIIATGESFFNDIESKSVDLHNISFVGWDECDLAKGEHVYVKLGKSLSNYNHIRKVGLSGAVEELNTASHLLGLDNRVQYDPTIQDTENRIYYRIYANLTPEIIDLIERCRQARHWIWEKLDSIDEIEIDFDTECPRSIKYILSLTEKIKHSKKLFLDKGNFSKSQLEIFNLQIERLYAIWLLAYTEELLASESIAEANRIIQNKLNKKPVYFRHINYHPTTRQLGENLSSLSKKSWHPTDEKTLESLIWAKINHLPCLVFCNYQSIVRGFYDLCRKNNILAGYITNETKLELRKEIVEKIETGKLDAIIATSAMERGADLTSLKLVINRSVPTYRESFNQRVGRVGRGDNFGIVHTIISNDPSAKRRYQLVSRGIDTTHHIPRTNNTISDEELTLAQRRWRQRKINAQRLAIEQLNFGI